VICQDSKTMTNVAKLLHWKMLLKYKFRESTPVIFWCNFGKKIGRKKFLAEILRKYFMIFLCFISANKYYTYILYIPYLGCPGVLSNAHNLRGLGPISWFFDRWWKIVYSIEWVGTSIWRRRANMTKRAL